MLPPRPPRSDTLFPYTTLFRAVIARRQLFQAVGLLELSDLQVLVAAAELVLDVGVEELVGLGVVTDHPFEAARALALERKLGAAQLELAVVAVGANAVEVGQVAVEPVRSEEHKSELQSLMRISYAVFGLKKQRQIKR